MARQPDILRPIRLNTTIPGDLRARLDLHLYSEVEMRVPKGAYQRFICERIREFFEPKPVIQEAVFVECDTCRAKPGSPTLCAGCLHNRQVIGELLRCKNAHP